MDAGRGYILSMFLPLSARQLIPLSFRGRRSLKTCFVARKMIHFDPLLSFNTMTSPITKVLDPKLFQKEPRWDWSSFKPIGSIIRPASQGCSYYDLSGVKPLPTKSFLGLDDIKKIILQAMDGRLAGLHSILKLRYGDLIQIGKSKNRGMFIMGNKALYPITQLLGGNGFGEIPVQFVLDKPSQNPEFSLLRHSDPFVPQE